MHADYDVTHDALRLVNPFHKEARLSLTLSRCCGVREYPNQQLNEYNLHILCFFSFQLLSTFQLIHPECHSQFLFSELAVTRNPLDT